MRIARMAAGITALVLSAPVLLAQQPEQRPAHPSDSMMARMQRHMQSMDSSNARLDTLVSRMNRATGSKKVAAMADVINELVTQRKAMQRHMREMMQGRQGMGMPQMGAPRAGGMNPPPAAVESTAADSAAHGQHHPPD